MAEAGLESESHRFWRSAAGAVLLNPRDHALSSAVGAALDDLRRDPSISRISAAEGLVHFTTSGSSGRPKIIGFSRSALLASARSVNHFLQVSARSVWLRILPRHHVGGFQVECRAWAAGAVLVCDDSRWDPAACVALCADRGVTHVSLVPTQVFDLVKIGKRAPSPLKVVLVGGGELRPALASRARSLGWPVRASYGLTEAASTVAVQAEDESDPQRLTLLPHWQPEVDAQDQLILHGPALPSVVAHWMPAARRYQWHTFLPPLRTDDRFILQENTMIFLGRTDRVVKRLGELIDLNHLERRLADAALSANAYGRVRLQCESDLRAGHRLVLECLDSDDGRKVAALFNAEQPPFARVEEIRQVVDLRLSPLGKPTT